MEIITDEAAGVCHATSDEDKGLATMILLGHHRSRAALVWRGPWLSLRLLSIPFQIAAKGVIIDKVATALALRLLAIVSLHLSGLSSLAGSLSGQRIESLTIVLLMRLGHWPASECTCFVGFRRGIHFHSCWVEPAARSGSLARLLRRTPGDSSSIVRDPRNRRFFRLSSQLCRLPRATPRPWDASACFASFWLLATS